MKYLLLLVALLGATQAGSLPKYIKKCSKGDPNFENCAIQHAKEAIPSLVQGDKSIRVPKLNPLTLPFVSFQSSLTLNFTDMDVIGLENCIPTKFVLDEKNKEITIGISNEKLILQGQYSAIGKVLVLTIQGSGAGKITFHGGDYTYKFKYNLVEKKGKEYAQFVSDNLSFTLKKADFDLQNLFNGDKKLGAEMNKFLNENWEVVIKDFQDSIEGIVRVIVKQAAANIFSSVSFQELFTS